MIPRTRSSPELQACGAEMSNVFIVPSAKIGDEYTGFDLNADLALIEEVVKGSRTSRTVRRIVIP